jgi:RNA polymerase sigma-70 factor (ECF subfamily)
MKPDEDLAAVERFLGGDKTAFDELVKKHEPNIRRLVQRYVKNTEDAKDVAQRAFVRAFEKIDTFRKDASFHTWLYRIAVNLALNHIRGAPPEEPLPIADIPAFTHSLATSRLVAADVWRKVGARLEQLPPMQRLAVELHTFHDLTFKEVAAIADCSEDAAKANYHHGVKCLKGLLSR